MGMLCDVCGVDIHEMGEAEVPCFSCGGFACPDCWQPCEEEDSDDFNQPYCDNCLVEV